MNKCKNLLLLIILSKMIQNVLLIAPQNIIFVQFSIELPNIYRLKEFLI